MAGYWAVTQDLMEIEKDRSLTIALGGGEASGFLNSDNAMWIQLVSNLAGRKAVSAHLLADGNVLPGI